MFHVPGFIDARGNASSLLVLRKSFREDKTILIRKSLNVSVVSADNDCFGIFACKYSEIFLFFLLQRVI